MVWSDLTKLYTTITKGKLCFTRILTSTLLVIQTEYSFFVRLLRFFINAIAVFIRVRIYWRSVTELITLRQNHLQDEYKHSWLIFYKRVALNSL